VSLESCQRWLWAAIQSSSDDFDPRTAPIHSEGLAAQQRVAIYANGYRLRLLECLQAEFTALAGLLGEPLFTRFALDYLRAQPSTSYTLHDLGAGFPEHLARTRPDAAGPSGPEAWVDFLIDLARLERLIREVYDGPGDERLPALAPCGAARSLRLLRSSHPVQRYLADVAHGRSASVLPPETVHLAVLRRDYLVHVEVLTPAEYALLERVVAGQWQTVTSEVAAGAGAEGLQRWLQRNSQRGLLRWTSE
jgi:hypothetical protein